jgi:hypothetical protein
MSDDVALFSRGACCAFAACSASCFARVRCRMVEYKGLPPRVRAPLTGIVLVLEMTDNYQLILPMIITCLGATLLRTEAASSAPMPAIAKVPASRW